MSILEALAIWKRIKPWLEKPWVKSILGFLAGLFKTDPNAPKVHGAHDPSKPNTLDDILKSENQPPV